MAETSYLRSARFDDVMLDLVLDLQRMVPCEVRDRHIEQLGRMVAETSVEVQRRADIAEALRPYARQG